jgi:hypothetical protein
MIPGEVGRIASLIISGHSMRMMIAIKYLSKEEHSSQGLPSLGYPLLTAVLHGTAVCFFLTINKTFISDFHVKHISKYISSIFPAIYAKSSDPLPIKPVSKIIFN